MHGAVSRFAYVTALTLCRNGQCRVECLVHHNGFLYRLKSSFSRNISKHSPASAVVASHSPQSRGFESVEGYSIAVPVTDNQSGRGVFDCGESARTAASWIICASSAPVMCGFPIKRRKALTRRIVC